MTKIILSLLILLLFQIDGSSQVEAYKKVRIFYSQESPLGDITKNGVLIENFIQNTPNSIDVELSCAEIAILENINIVYEILEDINALKSGLSDSLNANDTLCELKNFSYGTMGHFHSYKEIIQQLDLMYQLFPSLITNKDSIGRTIEGRTIYAVKISDNPNENEGSEEGVVYFDALHHAREPMSMETLLYYMWWLLENYDSDSDAKYLVNNRELHFVPIVNPDGYVFNETNYENGKGYWRKNRRDLGDGVFGVDLNRNYGTDFDDLEGSSNEVNSEVYHGEYAFSEPETQAVRDYLIKISPKTAFTCHSFGQMIISSPGCGSKPSDSSRYNEFSSGLINNFFKGYGSEFDMLNYKACGTTSDFMNEIGIYAWTPEIGTSFYPDISEFYSTVKNMLGPMKYISRIAGSYTYLNDFEITNSDGVSGSDILNVKLRIKNRGLSVANNIQIDVTSESDHCTVVKPLVRIQKLEVEAFTEREFVCFISPDTKFRDTIVLRIDIKENNYLTYSENRKVLVGQIEELFFEDAESNLLRWDNDGWETTNLDMQGGFHSIVDSKNGSYNSNDTAILAINTIDLTQKEHPFALFNARWSFGPYDAVNLLASIDDYYWDTLALFTNHQVWSQHIVDLSQYSNESLSLKFHLYSDKYFQSDGLYIDDFTIVNLKEGENSINQNGIKVFPNPTTDYVNILSSINMSATVGLYDVTGKLIYDNNFEGFFHSIDLKSFGKGLFVINIWNDGIHSSFKVLVD